MKPGERQTFRVWFKQQHIFDQAIVLDDLQREHAYYISVWWETLMTDVAELLEKMPIFRSPDPSMLDLLWQSLRRLRGEAAVESQEKYKYDVCTALLYASALEQRIRIEEARMALSKSSTKGTGKAGAKSSRYEKRAIVKKSAKKRRRRQDKKSESE